MKKEVNKDFIDTLERLKNKLLLHTACNRSCIIVIQDYKTETVSEKRGFFKKKQVDITYLTDVTINIVNDKEEFLGYVNGERATEFIAIIGDLGEKRENWLRLKKQIDLFGFQIIEKEK